MLYILYKILLFKDDAQHNVNLMKKKYRKVLFCLLGTHGDSPLQLYSTCPFSLFAWQEHFQVVGMNSP